MWSRAEWHILFRGPTWGTALPELTNALKRCAQRRRRRRRGDWTWKAEIRTVKKVLSVGEACMAIFWPTPDPFTAMGSQQKGTIISESAVPHMPTVHDRVPPSVSCPHITTSSLTETGYRCCMFQAKPSQNCNWSASFVCLASHTAKKKKKKILTWVGIFNYEG